MSGRLYRVLVHWTLILGLMMAAGALPSAVWAKSPVAENSVLDLSTWNFEEDGIVTLNGEWTVFPNELVDPLRATTYLGEREQVTVPYLWGPQFTMTPATGYGKATFLIRIKTSAGDDQLALHSFRMRSLVQAYAHVPSDDGGPGEVYLLSRHKNPDQEENYYTEPLHLPFTADTFDLIFQIENTSHKQGGIIEAPELGLRGDVEVAAGRDRFKVSAFVVILLGMSIIGLVLGLALKGGATFLWFSLVGVIGAARIVTTSQLYGDFFPELTISRKYDFEYLVLFVSLPAIYGLFASLFPQENFKKFQIFLNSVCCGLAFFALFLAPFMLPGTVTVLREPYQVLALATVALAAIVSFEAFRFRRPGAKLALASVIALLLSGGAEIAYYAGLIPYAIGIGQAGITIVGVFFLGGMVYRFRLFQKEQDELTQIQKDLNWNLEARTRELELANKKATAASEAKSNFLAVMSHEIRTPLTGILGLVRILESQSPDEEQRRLIETVHRSGQGLLELLNDILDISKIESGAIEMESMPFTLEPLIRQIKDLWEPAMAEKGLKLTVATNWPVEAPVLGDIGRIRQILHNLIGNARKFTDKGGVTVIISGREISPTMVEMEFAVRDTGIGIPYAKQKQIFGKFSQADASTTRQYGGSGLGLAICKQFTQLMGGRIEVESEPGRGSTFRLLIPCERVVERKAVDEEIAGLAENAANDEPGRSLQILVAEDVILNQEIIKRIITPLGHKVTMVGDGQDAVDACKEVIFDLVLMDLQMPRLDGLSATKMIRGLEGDAGKVPIFALSANVAGDIAKDIEEAGMDGHISKPIDMQELTAAFSQIQSRTSGASNDDSPEAGAGKVAEVV